ncbi:MAG: hypothetical protein AVDCRST_MAG22-2184, partial [uncultured Rubrobacteraceae bacterium]
DREVPRPGAHIPRHIGGHYLHRLLALGELGRVV